MNQRRRSIRSYGGSSEKIVDTGSKVITKYNMYMSENQKLLFPFEDELPEPGQPPMTP